MVPFRKNVGEKPSPASSRIASSLLTFERAYSVVGARGESSVTTFASDMPHTGRLCHLGQPQRRAEVDILRPACVHIADRVITQCGQMHDGAKAIQVFWLEISNILAQRGHLGLVVHEGALVEKVSIQTNNVVACSYKTGRQD